MGAHDRQPADGTDVGAIPDDAGGTPSDVGDTPNELAPLEEDWQRMQRIMSRLGDSQDLEERADLGAELVRAAARYEDALERSVGPALEGVVPEDDRAAMERARLELRRALSQVHERTRHIDPRNAHTGDPEGFERDLDEVVRLLEGHLPVERAGVRQAIESLAAEDRAALAEAVGRAARSASERPEPPRTAVGRALSNLGVRLDHSVEDVSTPHHPGAPTVDG